MLCFAKVPSKNVIYVTCIYIEVIPYSGKFSYGANFRIFRMKPRDTKIKTAKILTIDVKF